MRDGPGMVDAPDRKHDVLMQGRESPDKDGNAVLGQARMDRLRDKDTGGRLPYEGEVVGGPHPPYEITGLDALSPLLTHVEFPATKAGLIAQIGHARIAIDEQHTRRVAEVLEAVAPNEFPSSAEVEAAVKRAWDQIAHPPDHARGSQHWQRDDVNQRRPTS